MKKVIVIVVGLAIVGAIFLLFGGDPGISALPEEEVDVTKVVEGLTFKVMLDGKVYRVEDQTGLWHYHDTVYDPVAMEAAFQREGETVYRCDPESSQRLAVRRQFREDFEGLSLGSAGLRQLIGPDRGWGSLTLQSPISPSVQDYVALRARILDQGAEFEDAVVAPDDRRFHGGKMSLSCRAPAKPSHMITCKSSISTPLMYFRKDDDFWFRGWFYAESSRPSSLMDLECEWLQHHGGIRVFIDEEGFLLVELKALDKPKYRQSANVATPFPMNQWVQVQCHFHLSDDERGVIQLWQDNHLLIDTHGVTLPLPRVIYSSLEIGISSHSYGDKEAVLSVDDIEVSDRPFAPP